MDKKQIYAIAAVVVIVIAAVAEYMVMSGGSSDDGDDESTVHAVVLDGVEASETNVANGSYEISRNLVFVTLGEPTGNVAAFLNWVTSAEGQAVVAEEFVPLDSSEYTTYEAPDENGQTTIALGGSTSLSETAQRLAETYMAKYPYMTVTVAGGGSGQGESQTASGVFDVGMLSRDLGSSYVGTLVALDIGTDGVAVVCNIEGVVGLTLQQVADIFSGKITNWSEVGGPDETIRVIIREDGSGTRECFENAMKTTSDGSSWTVTVNSQSLSSTGAVITSVQTTYGSIGYISIGQLGNL